MAKVLVLYYSSYGHIETMAQAIAEGARSAGANVTIKRVPELVPEAQAKASHFKLDQAAPVATVDELADYDAIIFGVPTRFGNMAAQMKNFLDHFWHEFAGKLFATIVASHEKGLTVTDQLRTVARQCYAWTLPYGVSLSEDIDVKDGQIASDALKQRLDMLVRDLRVYGDILAQQRRADLAGTEPGFLARHRKRNVDRET